MSIDWKGLGLGVKKRREKLKITQDVLAARIGVRWNTIARIEVGISRPSLPLLEKLASNLHCRVSELLIEEDKTMTHATLEREPSLKGAPTYFRACAYEAANRGIIGHDQEGRAVRADYSHAGWHLGIHLDEYLTAEALDELRQIARLGDPREFKHQLLDFLDREFPGCLGLIPIRRREQFMYGVLGAIDEGRFPIGYNVSSLLAHNDR